MGCTISARLPCKCRIDDCHAWLSRLHVVYHKRTLSYHGSVFLHLIDVRPTLASSAESLSLQCQVPNLIFEQGHEEQSELAGFLIVDNSLVDVLRMPLRKENCTQHPVPITVFCGIGCKQQAPLKLAAFSGPVLRAHVLILPAPSHLPTFHRTLCLRSADFWSRLKHTGSQGCKLTLTRSSILVRNSSKERTGWG